MFRIHNLDGRNHGNNDSLRIVKSNINVPDMSKYAIF
jgi:hypothetical protein